MRVETKKAENTKRKAEIGKAENRNQFSIFWILFTTSTISAFQYFLFCFLLSPFGHRQLDCPCHVSETTTPNSLDLPDGDGLSPLSDPCF
jgi:hypothetical protein